MRLRLYIACFAILLAGSGAASVIYLTAGEDGDGAVRYEIINGVAYPVDLHTDKRYMRELQRFGGKPAVLFDEFGTWFAGLWRGKALASTIFWISLGAALGLFLFARSLPAQDVSPPARRSSEPPPPSA